MFPWNKDKRPEGSVNGSPGRQESNVLTAMSQAEKELSRLRIENNKLIKTADKYRVALDNERRKREAAEKSAALLEEMQTALDQAQKKLFEYEARLSDLDAQFWFFWNEMPKYTADAWLERWQKLAPPPLEERLLEAEEEENQREKER